MTSTLPPEPVTLTLPQPARRRPLYLNLHCLLLLGYVLLGKLFAYVNVFGVYVGEMVLFFGVLSLVSMLGSIRRILITPAWWLIALMVWGAVCTVPHLNEYGLLALRDAVIWGYGAFAIILGTYLARDPAYITLLMSRYEALVKFALVALPLVWFVTIGTGWYSVTVHDKSNLVLKGSDMTTLLAGVTACLLLRPRASLWLAAVPLMFALNITTRGGTLSFLISLAVIACFRPIRRRWLLFFVPLVGAVAIFLALDLHITLPNTARDLSLDTLRNSIASIFSESPIHQYEGTKSWRINWWLKIVDYTFNGEHLWFGKGFGVNLAYSDGVVPNAADSLRSPHSCHFTILARAGVPGLFLWIGSQATWLIGMIRCMRTAKLAGDKFSESVFQFLIVYWIAFIVNGSFDVFLEGPMAGIWFWSIYGWGLACTAYYGKINKLTQAAGVPLRALQPAGAGGWFSDARMSWLAFRV